MTSSSAAAASTAKDAEESSAAVLDEISPRNDADWSSINGCPAAGQLPQDNAVAMATRAKLT